MERAVRVLHVRSKAADAEDRRLRDDDRIAVDRVDGEVPDDLAGYDCVVVDDGPGIDPLAVCRTIRAATPGTPVVVAAPPGRPRAAETLVVGGTGTGPDSDGADDGTVDLVALVLAATGQPPDGDDRDGRDDRDRTGTDAKPGPDGEPVDPAKIRALHGVALDLVECETDTAAFERTVEAANDLLEFDQSAVYEREGDRLVPTVGSTGTEVVPREEMATFGLDEAAMGHVFQTGESLVVDDAEASEVAEPTAPTIRSGICVPLGDFGVFNAISDRPGAFDDEDLAMAEILAAHLTTAVERIRSEARTRRERDRFVALFEAVPDPVVVTDPTGEDPRIREANTAFEETFGVDAAAVEGDRVKDHVELPPGEERIGIPDDGYRIEEIRRETPDGVREFLFRGFALELGDDSRQVAVFTDITERNRRQRELERKTERLERFASIVSHDLRNPLSAATGWLERVEKEHGPSEALEEVRTALGRMESLIGDLLTLTRKGWSVEDPELVDARSVVERAWADVSTGDATLDCEWSATVRCDDRLLVEAFANLFRNCIEHGALDGEEVNVRVTPLADGSGVVVADDGPGIDPELRDSLFEFGASGEGDGTGVGLAVVERVVDAHGWSIRATESDQGGARFEIRFDSDDPDPAGVPGNSED